MEKPKGYDEVKTNTYTQKIQVDGYVCQIKKAVIQQVKGYEIMNILYDIAEGDYKDYYQDDFEYQKKQPEREAKWKGVFRLFLPQDRDHGTEKYENSSRGLKGFITSVERSNKGYEWQWDERTLSGKLVGLVYGLEEWEWGDRSGYTPKPRFATEVEKIRKGDFQTPKPKQKKNKKSTSSNYEEPKKSEYNITEDDLPF